MRDDVLVDHGERVARIKWSGWRWYIRDRRFCETKERFIIEDRADSCAVANRRIRRQAQGYRKRLISFNKGVAVDRHRQRPSCLQWRKSKRAATWLIIV